ncbi:MAG: MobF family relaxase, partial [Sphingomonadaceae bacterium]
MISLVSLSSGSAAAAYYSADNYYSAEQSTETSAWAGKGADELGLDGPVDAEVFARILDGKLPDGSEIPGQLGVHRPGLDLTFSASKSVSLLALIGNDKRLVEAVKDSVTSTLKWAEKNVIEARVWDADLGRQVPEKTGNMVAATFTHDINRNAEPQLHVHAVIANATLASDGKWHAVRNDELYRAQHVLSAIHNADLRHRIEQLGYQTEPARNPIDGAFEIKGVGREVIEAFSTRSAEIRDALAVGDRSSARERELAALSTRSVKEPELTAEQKQAEWQATAEKTGFNPAPLVEAALERVGKEPTIRERAMSGIRGIGARGMALVAQMGLSPRDGDALVPERPGRLSPVKFAAAQAVASAGRELGEREAAFSRNDLICTALQHYGPVQVADIESRIDLLADKGLLIAGEKLMTSEQAVRLEARTAALAQQGRGIVPAIADGTALPARLQMAARDLGLHRLNRGQEKAGVDILSSTDRVHLVQGGAGVGKSAALAPVASIARAEGRNVLALAHVGKIARAFGEKTGAPASTVDAFLARYARVLDGSASGECMAEAREQLSGVLIMVDEASQIGTERFARLIDLSNRMDVGRIVFAGDIRQLPAIEAGKPFEQAQENSVATSRISENLRAQSPQMKSLAAALEKDGTDGAFAVLAPHTREVPTGRVAETAAGIWANMQKDQRDQALLLASGRAMRAAGNDAAQSQLLLKGELGMKGTDLTVLDRVNATKEGAHHIKSYREGRVVEFRTNLKSQDFARGERGMVSEIRDGKVELEMPDGELRMFDPSRLPRNLAHDAVSIHEQKQISIHEGERIRWTDKDAERGLLNGDIAHVTRVEQDTITVTTTCGATHDLKSGDRILERLDLAYAVNAH